MTTKFIDHLLEGDHASRPAFGAVPEGTLYACSDHGLIYQSDGTAAWSTWATLGGGAVAAGDVSITDAGAYFTGTDVEAALQELGAGGGGGGGVTHTYVGYNTVGATDETFTTNRHYMKKITLAAAGTLVGIEAHIKTTSDAAAMEMRFMLFEDNAGTPRYLLHTTHAGPLFLKPSSGVEAFRWFGVGLSRYLAAGDYWIGFVPSQNTGVIKKDGSGSDRYFTAGGNWSIDAGYNAITTTTDRYSIRASILT